MAFFFLRSFDCHDATFIGLLAAVSIYRYRFFGRSLLNGLVFILILSLKLFLVLALLILFTLLNYN